VKSRWCGNGKVEHGEQCDPPSECCSKTCQFLPATTVCRNSSQICDAAEYCTGYSTLCPYNRLKLDGAKCYLDGYVGDAICTAGTCVVKPQKPASPPGSRTGSAEHKLRDLLRDAYKEMASQAN
jgi:hypothetical protein